ncbi:nicotinamide riboside transporter PnuC [Spirosoma radiotolerans]|uniref:Nicotinamide riboside transporter PnuC n=1 Tax=Spirosoma radiotolerans TaxID=1379870 RepID=A0A0E4A1A3_9BACT|nr:nicotinamide riboside transporter PnuC [Spirosoma radiotolerans]AKD58785.1 nicotinamide mononucleotide transporter [Spirosoma radiotolerans]
MVEFFDIHTIFFTLWDYPMSYLEFFGVLSGSIATWLAARANVWSWPIGAASVLLFFFLFFQIQLYPDMFLQVFFFITNLQGWWRWTHPKAQEADQHNELRITRLIGRPLVLVLLGGLVATGVLGALAQNLHIWFPILFSQPSAFPYLDSFTTVMSIIGTFMMIHKKLECWWIWLLVDIISTFMYFTKGVKLVGVEYAIFCLIAFQGAWHWTREYRSYSVEQTTH